MEIKLVVSIMIIVGIGYSIKKYLLLKRIKSDNRFAYYHVYALFAFWLLLLVFQITASISIGVITGLVLISSIIFGVIFKKSEMAELRSAIDQLEESLTPIDSAICRRSSEQLITAIETGEFIDGYDNRYIADAINNKWNQGVSILLDNGADPNGYDISGEPLLVGALKNEDFVSAKLLIAHGANTDVPEEESEHLLFYAIQYGFIFIVEACINQGVNINMQDNENEFTPLMHAVAGGNLDIVKLLLKNGADPNIGTELPYEGSYLYTSLDSAVKNNRLEILKYLVGSGKLIINHDDVGKLIADDDGEEKTEIQEYLCSIEI